MNKPINVNTDELYFDRKNPRIAEFNITSKTSEKEILKILWTAMGVQEIVLSIKASGFWPHEPLIAVQEGGMLVVIEGNRRLAALKTILHPELADFAGINKNVLEVAPSIKEAIKEVPVIISDSREQAWKFIGFKHINGPAKWGSYAKAQYISQVKKDYDISLEQIASQIGDTHRTVQKLYQGLQVIEQAEERGKFDRTDISANRLYFSHLYTGLSYDGFKDFLGLRDVAEETEDPVPEDKLDNLQQLLIWLYGSRRREFNPVVQSQNPDLRYLEAVIKNSEARLALKDGVSLAVAYELSQPKSQTFEESLLEAKRALQKAFSYSSEGYDGSDRALLGQAGSIYKMADELYILMEQKHDEFNGKDKKKERLTENDV